jgi:hypothetical protein
MTDASDKTLPPTPRTHRFSDPLVLAPGHPYRVQLPYEASHSPVIAPPMPSNLRYQSNAVVSNPLTSFIDTSGGPVSLSHHHRRGQSEQRGRGREHPNFHPYSRVPPPRIQTSDLQGFLKHAKLQRFIICLPIFLSLPPFFTFLYLVTGHAILRHMPSSIYSSPILSSGRAGAVGGAVLSLPILFLLWLGLPLLSPSSPTREAQEDFFDDNFIAASRASVSIVMRMGTSAAYFCGWVLILGISSGSIAGPIGVVCLGGSKHNEGSGRPATMLTPASAALAGTVGSIVCWTSFVVAFSTGFTGYVLWNRRVGT